MPERTAAAFAEHMLALLQQPPSRQSVRRYAEQFSWRATSEAQSQLFAALRLRMPPEAPEVPTRHA